MATFDDKVLNIKKMSQFKQTKSVVCSSGNNAKAKVEPCYLKLLLYGHGLFIDSFRIS